MCEATSESRAMRQDNDRPTTLEKHPCRGITEWMQQRLLRGPRAKENAASSSTPTSSETAHPPDRILRPISSQCSTNVVANRICFPASPSHNHHHHRRGQLPISACTVQELGNVSSENTYVKRDLGFSGRIGQHIFLSYGDTLYTNSTYTDVFMGMTSDSLALATEDPLVVIDVSLNDQGYPQQFCPIMAEYGEEPSTYALGITNVVETYPGQGILYFLLNHRPNSTTNIMGAGVAVVNVTESYPPIPTAQRLGQYWWDGNTEPFYGDCGAIRSGDYIYAYGHAKETPYVYLARVPWQNATDMSCYEYWNGTAWQTERLTNLGEQAGVFWQINQGQVVYSEYYQCFVFVYCDRWMDSKVLAMTAPAPEGPWSDAVTLYQGTPITNSSSIYAAAPHPHYDPTGKTLVVTFTNDPNVIQAINVTFA